MTTQKAKIILAEAGEHWTTKGDLKAILARTFDPLIKKACAKLLERPSEYDKLILTLIWR